MLVGLVAASPGVSNHLLKDSVGLYPSVTNMTQTNMVDAVKRQFHRSATLMSSAKSSPGMSPRNQAILLGLAVAAGVGAYGYHANWLNCQGEKAKNPYSPRR